MTGEAEPSPETGVEIFPVAIGHYDHHENLDVEAEAAEVAKLLAPFGGAAVPWDVPAERRDAVEVGRRLRRWYDAPSAEGDGDGEDREPPEGTVLHWVGHGAGSRSEPVLLDARSPDPVVTEGLTPGQLATAIRSRRANADHGDGWIIVVVDACRSAQFVSVLAANLQLGADTPRVLLIGTSAEGTTRLGRFSRALRNLLEVAYGGRAEIRLWELAGELNETYLPGCNVQGFGLADAALRRRVPLPRGLSGPMDMMAELKAVLAELDDVEREHFLGKGRGAEGSEPAWYFTGRRRELAEIAGWLRDRDRGMLVVTGGPGAGKSALLGCLLAQSRPRLRAVLDAHGLLAAAPEAERPPDGSITAGLLLAGMGPAEAVEAVASACGLGEPPDHGSPARLAAWLTGRARASATPITLLVDGLDEATEPLFVADRVLRGLAAVPGVRVIVGTRRGTGEEIGAEIGAGAGRHDILDALRGQGGDGDAGGTSVVEVTRDPEALRTYVEGRLGAAAERGEIGEPPGSPALVDTAMQVALRGREFLFARLAVRELLARPELITDAEGRDRLLAGDHQRLFASAVERLAAEDEANARLLEALAYARGRGLPYSGGVWEAVARALPGGAERPAPTTDQVEAFLRLAAPYVTQDVVGGETVYRLAHRTFQEYFAPSPEGHRLIVAALAELVAERGAGPPRGYLARHLSGHAVAAGMAGWRELARRPDVLDVLDARALGGDAVRGAFGRPDVPDEIVAIVGARDRLVRAGPADRRGIREIALARYTGASEFPRTRGAGWSVHAAWMSPRQSHAVFERRADRPLHAIAPFRRPDGRVLLAAAGEDGAVRTWDPETGERVRRWPGHGRTVRALAAVPAAGGRPGGRALLASAGDDGAVRFWDPLRGRRAGPPLRPRQGAVRALAAVPRDDAGVLLATGGDDGTVRLWDPFTREPAGGPLPVHDRWVMGMAVFAGQDGRTLLATAGRDKTVRVVDPASGEVVSVMTGHADWVLAVAAFPGPGGRTLLASGGADRTVRIWDPVEGTEVREPFDGHAGWVRDLAPFTGPDGRALLGSVGDDRLLRIWNPLTGEEIRAQPWSGHTGEVHAVCAFPGQDAGTLLATASADRSVRLWDPMAKAIALDRTARHAGAVNAVVPYHHDGRPRLATVGADRSIGLWDPVRGVPLDRFTGYRGGHRRSIRAVAAFKEPGRTWNLLATGGYDGVIRIWDPVNRSQVSPPLAGHRGKVLGLAVFPGPKRRALLASVGTDRVVRLWDPVAHTTFGAALEGHDRAITCVATLQGKGGVLLATGGNDRCVRLWDPLRHAEAGGPFRQPGPVLALAAVAVDDRRLLAAGGKHRSIRILDIATGERCGPDLRGHTSAVSALACHVRADGEVLLFSGSWDRSIRVWDVAEHRLRAVIPVGVAVMGLCVTEGRLVVAGAEGVVILTLP